MGWRGFLKDWPKLEEWHLHFFVFLNVWISQCVFGGGTEILQIIGYALFYFIFLFVSGHEYLEQEIGPRKDYKLLLWQVNFVEEKEKSRWSLRHGSPEVKTTCGIEIWRRFWFPKRSQIFNAFLYSIIIILIYSTFHWYIKTGHLV